MGQLAGIWTQLLVSAQKAKPVLRVRQVPQLFQVAQQSGMATQACRTAHQVWLGFRQTQFPQSSKSLGQAAGMTAQAWVAAHQVKPGFRVRQWPQLSQLAQQSGTRTQLLLVAHQVYPAALQTQFPQSSWSLGQSAGIA